MATKNYSKKLREHLEQEHKITPVSTYLKEIVYGGTDGIVTTFAVVGGFAGAQSTVSSFPILVVLLFGLANLFADGTSMGLSNFLSLRSEQDVYNAERKKELYEIKTHPKAEEEETIEILMDRGFSKKQAEQITKIYATNEKYWTDFMMNYELELPNPTKENPYLTGLVTFSSFIAFGFIPLIPYVFLRGVPLFTLSAGFTSLALLLLGSLRWKVTKESPFRSIGEILFLGGVSASIAYLVGTFFRT
ncbi:VIT1/CCC1 transporter family protein [Candidatus Roizmanbacteria bacterium]|nr:VIT1/CCC1 transporter family protein [Candidatus Roizmanbacteria bacterium]